MVHALLVFAIPAIAGGWSFYRQETYSADDTLQTALTWVFLIGVGLFMLTILFKALVSLPKCRDCGRKMCELETIDVPEKAVFGIKSTSRWRVVECPHCKVKFRIAGLS